MNADLNDLNEQARADRLAEALDRLLHGELPGSNDPLLAVAQGLIAIPVEPSAGAVARFDQQVNRWFNPPAAPVRPRVGPRIPLVAAGLALAIVLGTAGVVLRLTVFAPPIATATPTTTLTSTATPRAANSRTPTATFTITPTSTPTLTSSPTVTPTLTATTSPTASETNTAVPSFTATLSADPIFSQIFISGTIGDIQGTTITIFGQGVQVQDGVTGLCIGSWVTFDATVLPDGTLQVARSAITIVTSGCIVIRPPTSAPNPSGEGDDGDDHHHGKGDDD